PDHYLDRSIRSSGSGFLDRDRGNSGARMSWGCKDDPTRHSGKFSGHVQLDGLEITSDTTFDSIHSQLEKAGFEINEDQNVISAKKGEITIFTVETRNTIERLEGVVQLGRGA